MTTRITAAQAQPGDVLRAEDGTGTVYQYAGGHEWMGMQPIPYEGDPWQPDGELTVLWRDPAAADEQEGPYHD